MRRLLVAAAATLASASQPFSWADAQNAMHSCTNGSKPLVDKYAYRNLYRNAGAGPGRLDTIIPRGNIATPNARGRGRER